MSWWVGVLIGVAATASMAWWVADTYVKRIHELDNDHRSDG